MGLLRGCGDAPYLRRVSVRFFFKRTAATEIYTLSLHDALPICTRAARSQSASAMRGSCSAPASRRRSTSDRKSTRLNSSHVEISYAVFCLKKKKQFAPDRTLSVAQYRHAHRFSPSVGLPPPRLR